MRTVLLFYGGYSFGAAVEKWLVFAVAPDATHWPAVIATVLGVACFVGRWVTAPTGQPALR